MGDKRSKSGGSAIKTVSMTGFGRASGEIQGTRVDIEVKSLNNRYSDISLRLPREYSSLEPQLRELIPVYVQRGRVEINVSRKVDVGDAASVVFNRKAYAEMLKTFNEQAAKARVLDRKFKGRAVLAVLSKRESFELVSGGNEIKRAELSGVLKLAEKALVDLKSSRKKEGLSLGRDISQRLSELKKLHEALVKNARIIPQRQKVKLIERLRELASDISIDPGRLAAEAAILADRSDFSEELVRLNIHIKEALSNLFEQGTGRKLDFLLQEFVREFNTISSKAADADVAKLVVDAKATVEKIREQVQNLE